MEKDELCKAGLSALANLSLTEEPKLKLQITHECIDVLSELLETVGLRHAESAQHALACVANLAIHEAVMRKLASVGAIERCVKACQAHQGNIGVDEAGAKALSKFLSEQDEKRKQSYEARMRSAGATPYLERNENEVRVRFDLKLERYIVMGEEED